MRRVGHAQCLLVCYDLLTHLCTARRYSIPENVLDALFGGDSHTLPDYSYVDGGIHDVEDEDAQDRVSDKDRPNFSRFPSQSPQSIKIQPQDKIRRPLCRVYQSPGPSTNQVLKESNTRTSTCRKQHSLRRETTHTKNDITDAQLASLLQDVNLSPF